MYLYNAGAKRESEKDPHGLLLFIFANIAMTNTFLFYVYRVLRKTVQEALHPPPGICHFYKMNGPPTT